MGINSAGFLYAFEGCWATQHFREPILKQTEPLSEKKLGSVYVNHSASKETMAKVGERYATVHVGVILSEESDPSHAVGIFFV